MTIEERVRAGIEFLQERNAPLHTINLDCLDIQDYYACALGQLYGEYSNGLRSLNLSLDEALQYGFVGDDKLTDEWKRQLEALRCVA